MTKITSVSGLETWLKGKPPAFACTLAVRAALRVVPLLGEALCEDETERCTTILLPSFRALATANFAAAWPARAAEIREAARVARREAGDAIAEAYNSVQFRLVEYREIDAEILYPVEFENTQADARALGIAGHGVDAVVHAVQTIIDSVDAASGIAGPDAVFEAAISAAIAAHNAVDGKYGSAEFLFMPEEEADDEVEVAAYIVELWKAMELDAESLDAGRGEKADPADLVTDLHEKALWLDRMPVWVGSQWDDFKDELPVDEGWQVWIDWYEARLAGSSSNETLELEWVMVADEDWKRGPAHVNALIKKLGEAGADPLVAAITHGFEELDAVKEVIDLGEYANRIRTALTDDPSHVIGTTKEMLEATMKTILHRRGHKELDTFSFSKLTTKCLLELKLDGTSSPTTESERHLRKIASSAQKMIETANELRNRAGTGHGRVVGKEPVVTTADASLVASTGLVLAAWLLRHDREA